MCPRPSNASHHQPSPATDRRARPQPQRTPAIDYRQTLNYLVMRRSGVRFPKAALKAFVLTSCLFGRILEGQHALVGLAWAPCSPHLVRIQFRESPVELVRNRIKIVPKSPA
jgi:hypothetical protein